MCRVVAVCSGPQGKPKRPVPAIKLLEEQGVEHNTSGNPERLVGLLSLQSIEMARKECPDIEPGAFAEDITIADLPLEELPRGTRLWIGDQAVLEVTGPGGAHDFQFRPHHHMVYSLRDQGRFAQVISGGTVRSGDQVVILSVGKTRGD